jgi:hypothetical protein
MTTPIKLFTSLVFVFLIFGLLTSPVLGADNQLLKAIDKNGSVVNGASQASSGNSEVTHSASSSSSDVNNNDNGGMSADKIYSDKYILGMPRGNGDITKQVTATSSMRVITSSDIIYALILLGFTIGVAVVILGYFGSYLWNAIMMVYHSILNENAEESMTHIDKRRKSGRSLTFALAEILITVSVASYVIFTLWG